MAKTFGCTIKPKHKHFRTYTDVHTYTQTYIHTHRRTHIQTYTHTHRRTYIQAYTHTGVHTYTQTYTHTGVHTYGRTGRAHLSQLLHYRLLLVVSKQVKQFWLGMEPDMRPDGGLSASREPTDGTGVDCVAAASSGRLHVPVVTIQRSEFKMAVRALVG